jgi:hypothetical protein
MHIKSVLPIIHNFYGHVNSVSLVVHLFVNAGMLGCYFLSLFMRSQFTTSY